MTDPEKIADLELQVLTLKSHFLKLRSEAAKATKKNYNHFAVAVYRDCERVLNEC